MIKETLTEMIRRIIAEEQIDPSQIRKSDFLRKWYLHEHDVVNLKVLKGMLERFPQAAYSGPAFRLATRDQNGKFWIKPPSSWSKTLDGTKAYVSEIDIPDDAVIVTGNVVGIDLTYLCRGEGSGFMIDGIRDAEEVVAMKMPTNVKHAYNIDPDWKEITPVTETTKLRPLSESKNVGDVYHFTRIHFALMILQSNKLNANRSTRNYDYPTISTTRDKNFVKSRGDYNAISGGDIAFMLDGNKLSTRYKVKPYDDSYVQVDKEYDDDYRQSYGDEQEELWYGDAMKADKGFKNFKNYVKKVIITKQFANKILTNKKLSTDSFMKINPIIFNTFKSLKDDSLPGKDKLKEIVNFFKSNGFEVEIER